MQPILIYGPDDIVELPKKEEDQEVAEVLEALSAIKQTPYPNSFASRIHGNPFNDRHKQKIFGIDWQTRSPWMDLMADIRTHWVLRQQQLGEPSNAETTNSPIVYTFLQEHHLKQVHSILESAFWPGINISDYLEYEPEKSTIVATYKHLVVGVALLSSPREMYITYLAVRTGWEFSGIATTMLFHLISHNPHKDVTLHVSANNPAMLLYNQFGFKAEEFIVNFYQDYLPADSRASKNAFRLRLRRQ